MMISPVTSYPAQFLNYMSFKHKESMPNDLIRLRRTNSVSSPGYEEEEEFTQKYEALSPFTIPFVPEFH